MKQSPVFNSSQHPTRMKRYAHYRARIARLRPGQKGHGDQDHPSVIEASLGGQASHWLSLTMLGIVIVLVIVVLALIYFGR